MALNNRLNEKKLASIPWNPVVDACGNKLTDIDSSNLILNKQSKEMWQFHRLDQVSSSSESVLKPSWVWSAMQRDFQSCISLKIQIQSVLKLSWVLYAEELPKLSFAKNTNALRSPLPEVVDIHNDIQKCSKLSEMKDKSYICALISIKHHDHKKVIVKKMHQPLTQDHQIVVTHDSRAGPG